MRSCTRQVRRKEKCHFLNVFIRKVAFLLLAICYITACNQQLTEEASSSIEFKPLNDNRYLAKAKNYELLLAEQSFIIKNMDEKNIHQVYFENANAVQPAAISGNIKYEDLYSGIDLITYDKGAGQAGYDLVLKPGASLDQVEFQVGSEAYIDQNGDLNIPVEGGIIQHSAPIAYQIIEEAKKAVDSRFILDEGTLSFEVGGYDSNYDLVIDPTISFEAKAAVFIPSEASVFAIQASCTNGMVDANTAYLQISAATNATAYSWSQGSTYNAGATVGDNTMNAIGAFPVTLIGQGSIPNPSGSQDYTIRLFDGSDNNAFIDVTVTLNQQDCAVGCDCTDYIYLNDAGENIIHKFPIAADGGVTTEIGNPWFDGSVSLQSPHGIAADLNGLLYISQLNGGPGEDQSFIAKLTCEGELVDHNPNTMAFDPFLDNQGDHNFFSVGNLLYTHPNFDDDVPTGSPAEVRIYDLCTGALEGSQTTIGNGGILWGLTNGKDGYWYATISPAGFPNAQKGVLRGTIDPSTFDGRASEVLFTLADLGISPPPPSTHGVRGITLDDEGMIYLSIGGGNGFGTPSTIYKVDPTPPISSASVLAVSETDFQDYQNGNGDTDINDGRNWGSTVGLAFSERSGFLYASSQDDCVAVFNKNLEYQMALSNHTPASGFAKAIGRLTECCPTNNNQTVNLVQCVSPSSDPVFLNDIFPCEGGVICEAQWEPVGNAANIYEECNQTIMSTATAGCYTFTRSSDGTGSLNQCGAFVQTLNVESLK